MANIWISEFDLTGTQFDDNAGRLNVPVVAEPPTAAQNVTFTTATQSAAFNAATKLIRMVSDADCHVAFGADPTADTDDEKLIAGIPEWRAVTAGHKVSIVSAA